MSKRELLNEEESANYNSITLEVPSHVTDRVSAGAESVGESFQHFVIRAADERINRLKNNKQTYEKD